MSASTATATATAESVAYHCQLRIDDLAKLCAERKVRSEFDDRGVWLLNLEDVFRAFPKVAPHVEWEAMFCTKYGCNDRTLSEWREFEEHSIHWLDGDYRRSPQNLESY